MIKKKLGYIVGAIALDVVGVNDLYKGKMIYLSSGEHGFTHTTNPLQAKIFESRKDIKNLRFKNIATSSGEIKRDSSLYNLFGTSNKNNKLVISSIFLEEIEEIDEQPLTILHDKEIDPEYEEFVRLSKKFNS